MLFPKLRQLFKSSTYFIIATVLCTFLFISFSLPASAVTSRLDKGEANLNKIQAKTEQLAQENPPSVKDIQKRTGKGGLNEVQGTADKDKMISPDNAQGVTVKDRIENFLDNAKSSR